MYQVCGQLPAKPSFAEAVRLRFDPRAITLAPTYSYDHHHLEEAKSIDAALQTDDFILASALINRFEGEIPCMSEGTFFYEGAVERAGGFVHEQTQRIYRMANLRHFREIGVETPVSVTFRRLGDPYLCIETVNEVGGLSDAIMTVATHYIADSLSEGGYNLSHRNGEIMVDGEGIFQVHSSPFLGLENQVVVKTPLSSKLHEDRLSTLAILQALGERIAPVREFHPDWRSNRTTTPKRK